MAAQLQEGSAGSSPALRVECPWATAAGAEPFPWPWPWPRGVILLRCDTRRPLGQRVPSTAIGVASVAAALSQIWGLELSLLPW